MEKNIAKNIKSNSKAFWKYTQSKLKTKPGIPDLEKAETRDKPTFTKIDDEKADVFLNYFGSVFTLEPDSEMPNFEERNYKEILENIDLTEDMVLKKLKKLKINKSPGPDAIHPRVIQLRDCRIHYGANNIDLQSIPTVERTPRPMETCLSVCYIQKW